MNSRTPDANWSADYRFRSILTQREADGRATGDTFEELAVTLIATAADIAGLGSDPLHTFGETLLRTARPAALTRGKWVYPMPPGWDWAAVTITHHTHPHT